VVQGLELFALTIRRRFALPWPITIAAMFPVGAVTLAVVAWYLRGMASPVPCEYKTIPGTPASARTGEWHRCGQHCYRWQRKTDREHLQPRLLRWQVQRRGKIVERDDLYRSSAASGHMKR
jgi:hypothetical protein